MVGYLTKIIHNVHTIVNVKGRRNFILFFLAFYVEISTCHNPSAVGASNVNQVRTFDFTTITMCCYFTITRSTTTPKHRQWTWRKSKGSRTSFITIVTHDHVKSDDEEIFFNVNRWMRNQCQMATMTVGSEMLFSLKVNRFKDWLHQIRSVTTKCHLTKGPKPFRDLK